MSNVLEGAGLAPAPSEPAEPAATEPAASVESAADAPVEPAAPAEPAEPEIVVPEGAENPDAVKNAIKAERDAAKAANARARALEAQLREQQEQARPLEDRLRDADAAKSEAELRALRIEIGVSKGLSLTLAKRLSGSTAEEIGADADALAAEMGSTPAVPSGASADGGFQPPPPAAKPDPAKEHGQFLAALLTGNRPQ